MSHHVNWKLHNEVIKRDGYQCQKCGIVFDTKQLAKMFLVVHHVIPRSEGGEDKLDNLKILCFRCHSDLHPWLHNGRYSHLLQLWIDNNVNNRSRFERIPDAR